MRLAVLPLLFSALFLVSFPKRLCAQSTITGGLTGVVTDPSGAVVQDATVDLKDSMKGDIQTTKTDGGGVYLYSFLRPGSYTLTVAHHGFQEMSRALYIPLGPPSTLNMRLTVESVKFTINVTGEAPLLNGESGDVSATMNQLQVSRVPNPGNDLTYVAQIAPGVIMNTDISGFTNFSSLGMPGTSNVFTLNGMSYNDLSTNVNVTGALNLLLGLNQVQEATVVSNGYSGTFGSAAGANVNYVTKSGADSFHGNAKYFWNGRILNANNWFLKAADLPRPFDNANQWAASFGGAIRKNELFFFVNTEGIQLLLPSPVFTIQMPSPQFETATLGNIDARFGQGSASGKFYRQIFTLYDATAGAKAALPGAFGDPLGCFGFTGPNGLGTTVPCGVHFTNSRSAPTDESLASGRIDWNLRSKDRAFLLLQYDHGHQATYLDPINSVFDVGSDQPWWQGQLGETHTFGASGANQFLAAGWWISSIFQPANLAKALSAFPTTLAWYSNGEFTNLGGNDNFFPLGRNITQFQISDDFAKFRGGHKFEFGASFLRSYWSNFLYSSNVIGLLVPQTIDAFYEGGVDPGVLAGTDPNPDFTVLSQSFPSASSERVAMYHLGIYGEDEWHARPGLTLTFAVRAEHQSNPICERDCFARLSRSFISAGHDPNQPYNQAILTNQRSAFQTMDKIVWSPRFSFAWQPFGTSNNTVLRGGIGIFYDRLPAVWVVPFSSNSPSFNSFTVLRDNLTPTEVTSVFKTAAASNREFLNGFTAGENLAQMQAEIPNFAVPALQLPDAVTHSPRYEKWDLELQHSFGAASSLTLGYYGNHGIHETVVNPSANAFGFGSFPATQCTSPPVVPCADPRFSQVTEVTTLGVSNYNGMVVSFQRRFTGWSRGMFQANYTFGHAFDEASNNGFGSFTSGSSQFPQDPNNLGSSYGPAEYDVRHSFNANYAWELPVKALLRGHGSEYLVKGWEVAGVVFARTGFPYTVFDSFEPGALVGNNFFGSIYAVPAGSLGTGRSCGRDATFVIAKNLCQPSQVLPNGLPNPSARFVQMGCETGFNSGTLPSASGTCGGPAVNFAQGRNRFRGPSYVSTDVSIMKNTKLGRRENTTLGIGVQLFNAFNHPNFGLPDNNIADSGLGQIFYTAMPPTSILGAGLGGDASPRMIQIKAELRF